MTAKEFILEQLHATRNENNWFVAVKDAVKGLDAKRAAIKQDGDSHSVWEIVNHLNFWNGGWLMWLNGTPPPKMEIKNSGTFTADVNNDEAWKESVKKLDKILAEIEEKVNSMTDEDLKKEPFEGYGASWYDMFSQFTIHNAYHIGQIVLLRKLQGSWDPKQGVS